MPTLKSLEKKGAAATVDPASLKAEAAKTLAAGLATSPEAVQLDKLLTTATENPAEAAAITEFATLLKAQGAHKLVEFGLLDKIKAAMTHKKKNNLRQGAFAIIHAVVNELGLAAVPYLISIAAEIIDSTAERAKQVAAVSGPALDALRALIISQPAAQQGLIPALTAGLTSPQWQVQVWCLEFLTQMKQTARAQLINNVAALVPPVSDNLFHLRAEVKAAARDTVQSLATIVDNRDIEPFIPALTEAMEKLDEVPETIHKLASLTFVQTVDSAALGLIVPLLHRGFRERNTALKRQCSVIVANMSKLVEVPSEAAPFLPMLLPALEKASNEIADPEARATCGKAHEQLKRIETAAAAARPKDTPESIAAMISQEIGADNAAKLDLSVQWASVVCSSLANTSNMEAAAWESAVVPYLTSSYVTADKAKATAAAVLAQVSKNQTPVDPADEAEDAEELCDCKFTLAYGTKILLHNTRLKLRRGFRYGLLGGNDSGKSTLLRAIANGQVEGFPPATELRTVFVEADIQGEMSELVCLEYVFADERIQKCGATREEVARVMKSVGFTDKMLGDPVTTLSGGWRMKLALSRAMLQHADILLLDEPTNHLDVLNVAWVEDYLNSLTHVTSIIVSHNAGLLDKCCTHILQIEDLKLSLFKGNLSAYVEKRPSAKSFFELKASSGLEFKFPQPGFLEGVKTRGRALMRMDDVSFTYPGNEKPTISGITVRVSLCSRVACVGVNGAGKSTMIKLLTGELEPCSGTVWKHASARIAYVAQHAFHHIEQHLEKTPNQYIAWRYQFGEDKEALKKVTMILTPEEEAKLKTPIMMDVEGKDGKITKVKRVIQELTGSRRPCKKAYEYEARFEGLSHDSNQWFSSEKLEAMGFTKVLKNIDAEVAARDGLYKRPLTTANIEKHLMDVGLPPEFGTHHRMSALSGGQKVKVVLAAALWNQPHIIILDEPTNYLDRESLGALAAAIRVYEGGVVMITHNDQFCSELCPETWVLENGRLDCKGDAEWMQHALQEKVAFQAMEEMVDGAGNVIKVKQAKKTLTRKEQKARERLRKARAEMGEVLTDSEED